MKPDDPAVERLRATRRQPSSRQALAFQRQAAPVRSLLDSDSAPGGPAMSMTYRSVAAYAITAIVACACGRSIQQTANAGTQSGAPLTPAAQASADHGQ